MATASSLKEAGYRTASGTSGTPIASTGPRQRGFDYQYGPLLGEIDDFTHSAHGTRDWFRNNQPVKEQGYVTRLLGTDAVRLIESHEPRVPLFLYLAFTAPHAPYQAPNGYLAQYAHFAGRSACLRGDDHRHGRRDRPGAPRARRRARCATPCADRVPERKGGPRSAKFTGEVDMSKSTIPADNSPYRDGKGTLYEGGTRVVALANWPGRIPPGSVVDQPIHLVDMYPTLARLARAVVGKNRTLDGMDIWATLGDGKPSARDEVVYGIEPFRAAVRKGKWKLVWQATLPSHVELFNLSGGPDGEDQPCRREPPESDRASAEDRGTGARGRRAPDLEGSARRGETRAIGSVALPGDEQALEKQP